MGGGERRGGVTQLSLVAGLPGSGPDSQSLNKTFMAFALIDGAKFSTAIKHKANEVAKKRMKEQERE